MINPNDGDVVVVEMGGQTQILAQNTNGPANYELLLMEIVIILLMEQLFIKVHL